MNQGRMRGRGRGYRNFVRNDIPNFKSMDTTENKTIRNISHNKKCCEVVKTDFELDKTGADFFQELKQWWNMCEYFY